MAVPFKSATAAATSGFMGVLTLPSNVRRLRAWEE
jgi:hypothetical protein